MPTPVDLPTYRDILDYLIDYQRANPSAYTQRNARRAIVSGLKVISNAHQWAYLSQVGRVNVKAPYSTGTITYDHTGGAYERMVRLTDGVWPTWAPYGTLVIDGIQYSAAERRSNTELQLDYYQNPGEDVTASSYVIYRDTYTLPVDCATVDVVHSPNNYAECGYVHPREWLRSHTYNETASGFPVKYTITGDPDFQGQLAIRLYPYPDQDAPLMFMYQRRPRSNNIEGVYAGTVSISQGSTTVYGEDVTWDDYLVGSLMRFSVDGEELPTGLDGGNPYYLERMVMEVVDSQTITVDQKSPYNLAAVKYTISDPIDIEPGAMETAFLRCCEAQLAKIARFPDRDDLQREYLNALVDAKEADARSTAPRAVGGYRQIRRMADMPAGEDVD